MGNEKLVRVLEQLIGDFDSEIHNEYDGTSLLDNRLSKIDYAREALAAYRAAQPAGYVMVPVEPSEKMLDILYRNGPGLDDHLLVAIWAELLAAAYQREQVKGLVEALETIALESTDEQARCCAHHYLAAYRAAQEGK